MQGEFDATLLTFPIFIKNRKEKLCTFCHKKIRIRQHCYSYDSGWRKNQNHNSIFWKAHQVCYKLMLLQSLKEIEKEIDNIGIHGKVIKEKQRIARNKWNENMRLYRIERDNRKLLKMQHEERLHLDLVEELRQ